MAFVATEETKLQSLQYRIIHRIVPCNKWLYNIKIKENGTCDYCNETDDIQHFFIYCENIKVFWKCFINWWNRIDLVDLNSFSEDIEECIIFGFPYVHDIIKELNYCILIAKYYIYIQRLCNQNKIDFYIFQTMLKNKLLIYECICKNRSKPYLFAGFAHILDSLQSDKYTRL